MKAQNAIHFCIKKIMKKLLTLCCLFFIVVSSQATNLDEGKLFTYEFPIEMKFQKLIINGNIKVTLIPSETGSVQVVGKDNSLSKVIITLSKDGLFIDAPSHLGINDIHVIIPVTDIRVIEVNGNGEVKSQGYILSEKVNVLINGEATVSLKTKGKIDVKSNGDYGLSVSRSRGDVKVSF